MRIKTIVLLLLVTAIVPGCAIGRELGTDKAMFGATVPNAADLSQLVKEAAPWLPPPWNAIVPGAAALLLGGGGWKLRGKVHEAADDSWDEARRQPEFTAPDRTATAPPEKFFTAPLTRDGA